MTHVREDRLLHCLHRLSSLLSSHTVVLGAGSVESYCADCLGQLAGLVFYADIDCSSVVIVVCSEGSVLSCRLGQVS